MRRMLAAIATAVALTTLGALSTGPAVAKEHDAYNCINPGGHVRGWCRHGAHGSGIYGRVLSIGGGFVQFARNNGRVVTVNEQTLLAAGAPLIPGRYYSLRGYWAGGLFYATSITRWGY